MSYFITSDQTGATNSFARGHVLEAIKLALKLMGEGQRGVRITTPEGAVYSPAQFAQLLAKVKGYYADRT